MHGETELHGERGVRYTGGFVHCPVCHGDASLVIYGEGVDATFECEECGEKDIIR